MMAWKSDFATEAKKSRSNFNELKQKKGRLQNSGNRRLASNYFNVI